jgi:signal transduction histidine kinase
VNLIAVLQEVRREVEPLAGNTGVEVDFWIDGDLVQWNTQLPMEGERLYLADALANLIRNAIEASSDGDTVDIRVTTGDEYRIEIHNSGVVPEEIRHVFFDRYATSGKKNGTGLGTYVAALITRVHNGRIDFTTSEEDGTRVVLHLPRKQPASS